MTVSFTHFLRGPPTPLTYSRALSYSRLAADFLWLATSKTVGHCPGRLKLFDAAKVSVGSIKQLQSLERRREWRDLTRDKLTVGIKFHTRTLPALPPLVSVYRFPTICMRQCARIRLIRSSWPDGAADYCLPSIGYQYRANPTCMPCFIKIEGTFCGWTDVRTNGRMDIWDRLYKVDSVEELT